MRDFASVDLTVPKLVRKLCAVPTAAGVVERRGATLILDH